MADLVDGERGEDDADADAGAGLANFLLATPTGAEAMGTGGDAGRLYSVGEPGSCVGRSASSEDDLSSELTLSDV
ncbi:MAG TPA: hypothetical protein VF797_02510 [Noviherbaspirillum sp.]